jgi:hypothetical protein
MSFIHGIIGKLHLWFLTARLLTINVVCLLACGLKHSLARNRNWNSWGGICHFSPRLLLFFATMVDRGHGYETGHEHRAGDAKLSVVAYGWLESSF